MILVTGATGFVGRRLVRRLGEQPGTQVRVLLRPGSDLDRLPHGVAVHAMIGDLSNPDSLLAAMDGVHTVLHLVGTDTRGRHAELENIDVAGARAVIEAGLAARIGRVITVSRLGADRNSAFPTLRAKGEIEEIIRGSGLAYTILRSGVLFGEGDRFSEHLAMLLKSFPVFFVPGDGEQILQPLWVEDLVSCLVLSLQNLDLIDQVVEIAGPELFEQAKAYEKLDPETGRAYTWSQRESLQELEDPDRMARIKQQHEKLVAEEKDRAPNRRLVDIFTDLNDAQDLDGEPCLICHL